ncbi:hypothetical protein MNBD_GAMMA09-754 [hydrothermal vent metagenome]|uniref:Uncharacterized protein n=1 Tax=hydrothermal vent metagenome TaxID=652676 RepID=A0A3B0XIB4_9ZZZZ
MKTLKNTLTTGIIIAGLSNTLAQAGEDWFVSTTASIAPGSYSDSELRDSSLSGTLLLNADYLDSFSFAIAYNKYNIIFNKVNNTESEVNQDAISGRLQFHFFNDTLGGKITTQLVVHEISNNDPTTLTDDVSVIAAKLAYLTFDKGFYIDIEYAESSYPNNNDLSVTQWTPSLGFSFNNDSDWLSAKGYFIKPDNLNLAPNEAFSAYDFRWTHWLNSGATTGLNNFFLDVLVGERIYAVDNDALSVYNLADFQTGSFSIGATWKFTQDTELSTIYGIEGYENRTINNQYSQQYFYLGLTTRW